MAKPITLRAGDLRHVVRLQSFVVSSTDSRGQPVGSWGNDVEMRAAIDPVGPRDAQLVNQLMHDASHIVMVRHHPEIAIKKRLQYGTRVLHIGHVSDMGTEGRVQRLLCSEEL